MRRTMDATALNAIANHPDVRLWLGGDGPVDFGPQMRDASNIAVVGDVGGFLAVWLSEGRYEIHSVFLPNHGTAAVTLMREGLDYLFSVTEAIELVTRVPVTNAAAAGLARLGGFQVRYRTQMPWSGGTVIDADVCALSVERWASQSRAAWVAGMAAHDAFAAARPDLVHQDDDDTHLQMAGAAWLLVRGGQVLKAAQVYGEYAAMSGHPPFRVLRTTPPILDLGSDLVVEVRANDFEVLTCQAQR